MCVKSNFTYLLLFLIQGENVIHGVSCRLEAAMQASSHGSASNVFGLLHAFADKYAAKQKVRKGREMLGCFGQAIHLCFVVLGALIQSLLCCASV